MCHTICLCFPDPSQCHFLSKILEGMGNVGQKEFVFALEAFPDSSLSCQPTESPKFYLICLSSQSFRLWQTLSSIGLYPRPASCPRSQAI